MHVAFELSDCVDNVKLTISALQWRVQNGKGSKHLCSSVSSGMHPRTLEDEFEAKETYLPSPQCKSSCHSSFVFCQLLQTIDGPDICGCRMNSCLMGMPLMISHWIADAVAQQESNKSFVDQKRLHVSVSLQCIFLAPPLLLSVSWGMTSYLLLPSAVTLDFHCVLILVHLQYLHVQYSLPLVSMLYIAIPQSGEVGWSDMDVPRQ